MAVAEKILHITEPKDPRAEKALVQAAQAGQPGATGALIERHYPRVYSFVSYLTNGRGNSEDLTQEVFTRALSALPRFNGQYQFEPWLLRIAKNLVIDESRRDVHRALPTDPTDLPELESEGASMDVVWESMSSQLASSVVKRTLERLPMRQRTVLVLREIEGMGYADIAQIVGTNIRGVEATLRRARERFRVEVANAEADEQQRAVCKRTLRILATHNDGTTSIEAARHLRRCADCRAKSESIRKADGLFGLLLPLGTVRPSWIAEMFGHAPEVGRRSILEFLRGSSGQVLTSPMAHLVEAVASVAVAGIIAVSSIAAPTARVAGSVAAPVAAPIAQAAPDVAAEAETSVPSQWESVPVHISFGESDAITEEVAAAQPSTPASPREKKLTERALAAPSSALPEITGVLDAAPVDLGEVPVVNTELVKAIADVPALASTTSDPLSKLPVDTGSLPLPEAVISSPVTPAVALPRRRRFFR